MVTFTFILQGYSWCNLYLCDENLDIETFEVAGKCVKALPLPSPRKTVVETSYRTPTSFLPLCQDRLALDIRPS